MKKKLLVAALIALATAAGLALWPRDPVAARWDDYLTRLERITRQPIPPAPGLDLRPYPGNAALRRPLPDLAPACLTIWHCAIAI